MNDQLSANCARPIDLETGHVSLEDFPFLGYATVDEVTESAVFKVLVSMEHGSFERRGKYVLIHQRLVHGQVGRLVPVRSPVGWHEEKSRFHLKPVAPVVVH